MAFRCMESERRMCKTSNTVGHPGHVFSQTLPRLHLILPRKATPDMVRPRLLHHTLVGVKVEAGMDDIIIQILGMPHIF